MQYSNYSFTEEACLITLKLCVYTVNQAASPSLNVRYNPGTVRRLSADAPRFACPLSATRREMNTV